MSDVLSFLLPLVAAFAITLLVLRIARRPKFRWSAPPAAAQHPPRPMRVVCAWCQEELSPGVEPVSHGICRPCAKAAMRELASERIEKPEANR